VAACLPLAWGPYEPGLSLWPWAGQWPKEGEITRGFRLDALWRALETAPPGRVLFVRSALSLDWRPEWWRPHTHIGALAPLRAGRAIVGGTFTHPSPVAARFYTGQTAPPARLTVLAEQLDGQRLLGQPWERLSPAAFDQLARRLRIGTVVVPAGDASRARFLGPDYALAGQAAGFALFERKDRPWPRVERITSRRYRVLVSPTGGVWIPTGIPAYPLWQVKSAAGRLEMRVDDWGLLELRVPVDLFEAELVYGEGWLEWSAFGLFALGAGAWLVWAVRARAPGPAPRVRRGGRS
jgi:hypothetical protein